MSEAFDYRRALEEYFETVRHSPPSMAAEAKLQVAFVEEVSGAIGRLVQVMQASTGATTQLSRRLVFLNWVLVALTVILVVLGILTLSGFKLP